MSSGAYDYQTGLAVAAMDANAKTTSMEYNDPLERLRKVTKPDALGTMRVDYDPVNHKITQYDSLDAGREVAAEAQFDGLGRVKRTERTAAGAVKAVTETKYDALGRAMGARKKVVLGHGLWETWDYSLKRGQARRMRLGRWVSAPVITRTCRAR